MIIKQTEVFQKWIHNLKDKIAQSIITARIRRLSNGNFGNTKSIENGIFELRIDYGPGFRVYFIQRKKEIIILLCGGDKSTQDKDIKNAKQIAQNLKED